VQRNKNGKYKSFTFKYYYYMKEKILNIVETYGKSKERLMDILLAVQEEFGCVSDEAVSLIAKELGISEVDVNQTKTFYHFFTSEPVGKYSVYLNNSAVSMMMGMGEVIDEFEKLAGIKVGEKTSDDMLSMNFTACIGMSDQEPAALINNVVFTELNREKVRKIFSDMQGGKDVHSMYSEYGDGNNANPLMKSMVKNNIRRTWQVCLADYKVGVGLSKALSREPSEVIAEIRNSELRGRGGAGFPTGLKMMFCAQNAGERYVFCNADEGEPGTFKDRVLLTERAPMVFEGMAISAYAIGAKQGIVYLRYEYKYMKAFLEIILEEMRSKNFLGKNILGKGFDFDIRIQLGAGAYVCGEESALIESTEGKRGEPRNRPPFPVQKGYMESPTIINNVETFCSMVKIIENGSTWYRSLGTNESSGTKLLSISGDCEKPGVYEVEWGMTIREMLEMVGAKDVQAVQVAGPSGICVPTSQFDRKIAIEDLPTGGSMIVIGKHRDIINDVVLNFMEFFEEESCGSCVTCRSFNMILTKQVRKVVEGRAIKTDLDNMVAWSNIMRKTSRCGLGQTSGNPVLTTLENFPDLYKSRVEDLEYKSDFDMDKAILEACEVVGRPARVPEHN
jgi:[NiFe] hydrogenase diaphorase moiety large subunit